MARMGTVSFEHWLDTLTRERNKKKQGLGYEETSEKSLESLRRAVRGVGQQVREKMIRAPLTNFLESREREGCALPCIGDGGAAGIPRKGN